MAATTSKRPIDHNNEDARKTSKYFKCDRQFHCDCDHCEVTVASTSTTKLKPQPMKNVIQACTSSQRLSDKFFNQPCKDLAISLLGCTIVRKLSSGQELRAKIVETEGYLGVEDKAAHSYKGKHTDRNEPMFMAPGTLYVYSIYGMYNCVNISSQGAGCAVLLRAAEPLAGINLMESNRKTFSRSKSPTKTIKPHQLCNGPSKLCMALDITKAELNKENLCDSERIWIETDGMGSVCNSDVVSCPRINIGYAEDWVDRPLRFYVDSSKCVSVRHKTNTVKSDT